MGELKDKAKGHANEIAGKAKQQGKAQPQFECARTFVAQQVAGHRAGFGVGGAFDRRGTAGAKLD